MEKIIIIIQAIVIILESLYVINLRKKFKVCDIVLNEILHKIAQKKLDFEDDDTIKIVRVKNDER